MAANSTSTMTLQEATLRARIWAVAHKDTSVYADAALAYIDAIKENREEGVQLGKSREESDEVQYGYILCNLNYWRGPEAQEVKKVIKAFLGVK